MVFKNDAFKLIAASLAEATATREKSLYKHHTQIEFPPLRSLYTKEVTDAAMPTENAQPKNARGPSQRLQRPHVLFPRPDSAACATFMQTGDWVLQANTRAHTHTDTHNQTHANTYQPLLQLGELRKRCGTLVTIEAHR